jgi:hypothetical protein
MPSKNLRNNKLEFTPTFGTQQYLSYIEVRLDETLCTDSLFYYCSVLLFSH